MSVRDVPTVTRTVTISDMSPQEMASVFCAWTDVEQAAFFDAIHDETKDWPGTGWSMQSLYIMGAVQPEGRAVVQSLADYLS